MKFYLAQASVIFSILFLLSSCQTIESRGQFIDDNLLSTLEAKRLNKSGVEELVGTPTIIPDYTPNTWYYIQRTMGKRAWFEPKVIEQRIVKVTFNRNNLVEEVKLLNDSHNDEINIITEYTKTYGTELNWLQKYVKNFGRFNQTTKGKKKSSDS